MSKPIVVNNDIMLILYNDHHRWLYGWLCKKLGCYHQAADIAQDTFLRILLEQQKKEKAPVFREPRAYLTTVAGRLVYDHFRRQSLEKSYLDLLSKRPEIILSSPQEQLIVQEALLELDALFDRMKPAVRTAFLLSKLEGLSYAKIAVKLNVSVRTVKRYMAKAFEECIMTGLSELAYSNKIIRCSTHGGAH